MGADIKVSVLAKDFVSAASQAVREDPEYSGLQTTRGGVGFVEWKVNLPQAGLWRMQVQLAAALRRSCQLTINGAQQAEPILAELTGSWLADTLQWFTYGPYSFKQGENLVRIDFAAQSHLKELAFTKVDAVTGALPWRPAPGSCTLRAVTVLQDGRILGVGTNYQLYFRSVTAALIATPEKPSQAGVWMGVPGSGSVLSVSQLQDGTLVGVGGDHSMYTRATLESPWVLVPQSQSVNAVTQMKDGALIGVGTDNQLWRRSTLTSPWFLIPSSGSVISIYALPDGALLGVGTDKQLYLRATLGDNWVLVPGSGPILSIARLLEGPLVAVGPDSMLRIGSPSAAEAEPPATGPSPGSPTATPPPTAPSPDSAAPTLQATGLEDYGYWLRWKQSLPPSSADNRPFRRGVIWR